MSNVSVVNSTFVKNSAEVGGAMYSDGHEVNHISIIVRVATFIKNQAIIIDRHSASCDGRKMYKKLWEVQWQYSTLGQVETENGN